MNKHTTLSIVTAAAVCLSLLPAYGQSRVIGSVANVVPDTIRVSPDGEHVICVTVDARTQKRRVKLDGKLLPGWYDAIADGTPFFSVDGNRHAFVGTRGTNCMAVVDGVEQPAYAVTTNRWPITGLLFGTDGTDTHVAYQVTLDDKHYVVVNGQRQGGYDSIEGGLPGIWDFHFVGSYFAYRGKKEDRMVACRGRVEGDRVSLVESRLYRAVGAGSPVWMGGKTDPSQGDFFAFIAQDEPDKERILQLPGDTPLTDKTWKHIARHTLQASPAGNGEMAYVAGDTNWHVVVGVKEWPGWDTVGPLASSPSGKTWACTAKTGEKLVVLVNGAPGKAYAEIQHGETLFPAGDERVVFGAAVLGDSKTPAHMVVDGKEGKGYAQVRGDSAVFSTDGKAMAYVAGDGNKNVVVVNGTEGPAFDDVGDLRFSLVGAELAYRARRGVEHFVVLGGKPFGPYGDVKSGSLVFGPDGNALAWAAFGADGFWQVNLNGKPIDAGCDGVVSRITFVPGVVQPAYVGRFVAEGRISFALSYGGELSRQYGSIWMGDGGKLFVREDGGIAYFAKSKTLLYRVETGGSDQ